MSKEEPNHKDKLGRDISIGDFVAYPGHNSLYVGKVTKLNPKMVKVLQLPRAKVEHNKYSSDTIRLEQKDMTWFMLKNGA